MSAWSRSHDQIGCHVDIKQVLGNYSPNIARTKEQMTLDLGMDYLEYQRYIGSSHDEAKVTLAK